MEGVYKVLRDEFGFSPRITRNQFFGTGFGEQKIILAAEIISRAMLKHEEVTFAACAVLSLCGDVRLPRPPGACPRIASRGMALRPDMQLRLPPAPARRSSAGTARQERDRQPAEVRQGSRQPPP